MDADVDSVSTDAFAEFVERVAPRLQRSLMASLGGEAGREATAVALSWAWEHWDRVSELANPAGYLYRLGRNRGVSEFRRRVRRPMGVRTDPAEPMIEPGLERALAALSEPQRTAVVLIHGFGWTYGEVAEHLGVTISTVQTHTSRAMARLRKELKVDVGH